MKILTHSYVRQNLEILINEITDAHEPVRIEGERSKPIIMVDAEDFESLTETAYLLCSPANAKRLMRGLDEFKAGKGIPLNANAIMDAGSSE
ncbi:type II toxin-antitoxin system Phd/YefM family antitoxin [Desulfobacterales bacterium HSG16]|nr:type II toxin-antitoxin system Phd/YefM family antitoxin [Desulfobacterales bacterium HSG16]